MLMGTTKEEVERADVSSTYRTSCPIGVLSHRRERKSMKKQHNEDQVVPYPKVRRFLEAAIRSTHHKPMIHGLIEVDVSRARAFLREHQAKTGESLSFTAFLIACLAKAVDEHKAVQAFRKGRNRLTLFEDVDVLTYIERDVAGQKQIMPSIIR